MNAFFTTIIGIVILGVGLYVWGLSLPATRQATVSAVLSVPPSIIVSTIRDVETQPRWRKGITSVQRTPEGWRETLGSGEVIEFTPGQMTETRIELEFSSRSGYTGQWTAELVETGASTTALTITESATTPSPIGRIVSRLVFDPETFAKTYLDDLRQETLRQHNATA